MATLLPKQDERGRFYRNIGYVDEHTRIQPKILLGRDRTEATARLCRIVQLWDWLKQHKCDDQARPCWGKLLPLARAIGNEDDIYRLPRPEVWNDTTYDTAVMLLRRTLPPVIRIEKQDNSDLQCGELLWEEIEIAHLGDAVEAIDAADHIAAMVNRPKDISGTVRAAISVYQEHLKAEYHDMRCLGISGQSNSLFFTGKEGRSDGPTKGKTEGTNA